MNNNREVLLEMLEVVADALGEDLRLEVAFVGGCTTMLLITDAYTLEFIRGTDDVDLVVKLEGTPQWYALEQRLKTLGFRNTGEDDVTCRFRLGAMKVDFMPTVEAVLGFANPWFAGGLASAITHRLPSGTLIKVFPSPWFLAAKLCAYAGRGRGDPAMSSDIEDVMALIDGRPEMGEELLAAPPHLREFVANAMDALYRLPAFEWVISSTAQGEERLELLHQRIQSIIACRS